MTRPRPSVAALASAIAGGFEPDDARALANRTRPGLPPLVRVLVQRPFQSEPKEDRCSALDEDLRHLPAASAVSRVYEREAHQHYAGSLVRVEIYVETGPGARPVAVREGRVE